MGSFLLKSTLALLLLINGSSSEPSYANSHSNERRGRDRIANVEEETRSLDQIYQAALAEGGRLILYAGGDTAGQQDSTKATFEQRFPNITIDIIVDYSKYHGSRIEYQLSVEQLIPDVVQLQTVQDFPRWKAEGALMAYKPAGWAAIHAAYRDPDATHMSIAISAFSNNVNILLVANESEWPREAADYLKPMFAGKLAITYPNDDDAVLFWFKQVVDKYGWQYVTQFVAQNSTYVRGTAAAIDMVGNGSAMATMTSSGLLTTAAGATRAFVLPQRDPFVLWARQAAIFKQTKHPEAAKLYMNWVLSLENQQSTTRWSVREDVPAPAGYRQSWEYGRQASHQAFAVFMQDRAGAEMFRQQITLFFGEPQGPPSPGIPGVFPEKALPH